MAQVLSDCLLRLKYKNRYEKIHTGTLHWGVNHFGA
jgi:hypothetical protein